MKQHKETTKISPEEFENFTYPFFIDLTEEQISFLQQKLNKNPPKIKPQKHEFNFLISSLKPKRRAAIQFVNSLEQKPETVLTIRRKYFNIKMKLNFLHRKYFKSEKKNKQLVELSDRLEKQIKINWENKLKILKILEDKIPIIAHKKIQLAYDYQIISFFKSNKTFLNHEAVDNTKPLILKSLLIEKLEYLNLFDKKEWAMCEIHNESMDNLLKNEDEADFDNILP
ncbi:hypothetical protein CDIK_0123 [Cucumispora dikerogammari]|nr:hypothetical protein CDIK_0123 [Cucumispora dikerogammari]